VRTLNTHIFQFLITLVQLQKNSFPFLNNLYKNFNSVSRLNFSTAFSSNAVSIFHSVGLTQVSRVELSTRYYVLYDKAANLADIKAVEEKVRTKEP